MKSNDELIKEFEDRRNFTIEECENYIQNDCLAECTNEQIMEVDNIFDYMKSLGYSTLDEIKDKYNL
jgi:hypothetical protein